MVHLIFKQFLQHKPNLPIYFNSLFDQSPTFHVTERSKEYKKAVCV